MEAISENKDCIEIIHGNESQLEEGDGGNIAKIVDFDKRRRKAKVILVTALRDKPLKAVQKHTNSLKDM